MAKFPAPPDAEALRAIEPAIKCVRKGTPFARIYFAGGEHPVAWNAFRRFGPTDARFDHHLPGYDGNGYVQDRSILYAASAATTCLAEVFQTNRVVNKRRREPWLAVFTLARDVDLVDLTGNFATRMGASTAIHSGARHRARLWAQRLYDAYPHCAGIAYCSSMNGNAPAFALTDRAETLGVLPLKPAFNRALADAALTDLVAAAADDLGYGLT